MQFAVAMNERLGHKTSSPGPIPAATIPRCSAVVQDDTAMACLAPTYSAKPRSNSSTRFPWLSHPLRSTCRTASSSSLPTKGRATGMIGPFSVLTAILLAPSPADLGDPTILVCERRSNWRHVPVAQLTLDQRPRILMVCFEPLEVAGDS